MAQIDFQKEKVNTWRVVLVILIGTLFTIIGYVFNSYDKLNEVRLILSNITGFIVLLLIIFTSLKLNREIEKLKDL